MNRSALLDLHVAAGARVQETDPPRLLTFGDVPAEYEAATRGCAMFDQTDRGLVRVTGSERAAFLHRLLANRARDLPPGSGNRNLLLSPKGRVLFDFDLDVLEDELRLSVAAGRAPALLAALDMYLFAEEVTLEDATDSHAPIDLCGPDAAGTVRDACGVEPPTEDHASVDGVAGGELVRVTRLAVAGSPGWRVDGGPEAVRDLWETLRQDGAVPAGVVARDILRVEVGAALEGEDVTDEVYPQEARLEPAFSLDKGCYIGQEVVAKIDTYGGLNKRLVALKVSHDDPIARGTRLLRADGDEWRDLGQVTSWAYSFVLDTGLVLAYVKRRHQDEGTVFRVGDTEATAEIVALPVRTQA